MKNEINYRKIPLIGLIFILCIPFQNQAQSVKRESVSCYGSIAAISNTPLEQTVGQPYNSTASFHNKGSVFPGFQQSAIFKAELIKSPQGNSLKLKVYPNPATATVIIQSMEPIENSIVRVLNLKGEIILDENAGQLINYTIDCTKWSSGTYIITVSDSYYQKRSTKLIINK
jgi:hypothetical protein